MKRLMMAATAILAATTTAFAFSDEGGRRFREFLNGYKEAAAPIATTGTGTFRATINKDETEIDYELTFENLEGDVRQAHIHIGHPQGRWRHRALAVPDRDQPESAAGQFDAQLHHGRPAEPARG